MRLAAVAVARELERRRPDLMTAAWWKEERGSRVFIDFNQNAPHKTVFGAWCVRANPHGQVSYPFRWDELESIDPPALTLATVPARLAADRRPVGGHVDEPPVARAGARPARARPRRRAARCAVAAGVPQDAPRAASGGARRRAKKSNVAQHGPNLTSARDLRPRGVEGRRRVGRPARHHLPPRRRRRRGAHRLRPARGAQRLPPPDRRRALPGPRPRPAVARRRLRAAHRQRPVTRDGGWAFCSGGDQRIRGKDGYTVRRAATTRATTHRPRPHRPAPHPRGAAPHPLHAQGRDLRGAGLGRRRRPQPPRRVRPHPRQRRARPLQADRRRRRQLRRRLRLRLPRPPGRAEVRPGDLLPRRRVLGRRRPPDGHGERRRAPRRPRGRWRWSGAARSAPRARPPSGC